MWVARASHPALGALPDESDGARQPCLMVACSGKKDLTMP